MRVCVKPQASPNKQFCLFTKKDSTDAEQMVVNAKEKYRKTARKAKQYPEIIYGGMFSAAFQEYAEANIFLILVKEEQVSYTSRNKRAPSRLCAGFS